MAALDGLAERYADLDNEEALAEVEQRQAALAERGVDVHDPVIAETILMATRAARATPPAKPADEARKEGATLETDAGASGAGERNLSEEDQWWEQVKGASSGPWD